MSSEISGSSTHANGVGESASDSGSANSAARSASTMSITFKLYATLQDLLPPNAVKNAATIEVASDVSLNELIDRFRVPRDLAHLVLVNGVFHCDADRDQRNALKPDDVVAIWPPVAGG